MKPYIDDSPHNEERVLPDWPVPQASAGFEARLLRVSETPQQAGSMATVTRLFQQPLRSVAAVTLLFAVGLGLGWMLAPPVAPTKGAATLAAQQEGVDEEVSSLFSEVKGVELWADA